MKRRRRPQERPKVKGRKVLKAEAKILGEDISLKKTKVKARANILLKPHGHQHFAVPTIFHTGESDWTAGRMSTCSM